MLTRLHLIDFKSFADQAISLGRTTLLVGVNAAGKSNFLDALRFLQGLRTGEANRASHKNERQARHDSEPGSLLPATRHAT
ncbi:MAG: AAA family ATPase [Pseudomonadota bacterium]